MKEEMKEYLNKNNNEKSPLFLCGNALEVLKEIPDNSIDCCLTSPPYWNKREYENGGIGLESTYQEFIDNLLEIFEEVYRVLKPTGSFWLNIGDTYKNKCQLNIPWRLSISLTDNGWTLRNTIIWNKVKGSPDNSKDKLRNLYEPMFHFVKNSKGYYYDIDAVRNKPKKAKIEKGAVVSATGVTGVRYKRKIELSTALTAEQKAKAMKELNAMLEQIKNGEISDFRMIIKGESRTTHSNSEKVSGRSKELNEKGYYFLKYHPNGSKPGDIWDIIPEDAQGRTSHFAPYPEDLCRMPIILTCPEDGVVLDPFCGTGTTSKVASMLCRKSISIDISNEYINSAVKRCM